MKKKTYYDGHEAPANIADRVRLYNEFKKLGSKLLTINEKLEIVNRDTAEYIEVVQDETICYSNHVQRGYWGNPNKVNCLPPKSDGIRIMSSDFITPDGYLMYNDAAWERVKNRPENKERVERLGEFQARIAGRLIKQGYYNSEQCAEDFYRACQIIKENYNGKYKPIFFIDHSPIHKAIRKDALHAQSMNVSDGGKQRYQCDGYYHIVSEEGQRTRIRQSMVFEDGPKKGKQKGLRTVCLERFGPERVAGLKKKEDFVRLLQNEEDFAATEIWLKEIAAEFGGDVIFNVKFHPELSAIELFYRDHSLFMRVHNIIGETKEFEKNYELAIQSVPIETIRRYFLSGERMLEAYMIEDADGDNVMEYYNHLKLIQGFVLHDQYQTQIICRSR